MLGSVFCREHHNHFNKTSNDRLMPRCLLLPRRKFILAARFLPPVRFYSSKMPRILCVAEKPSIARAVAGHLSGGQYATNNTRDQYTKNYVFTCDFGPPWGQSSVTMTAVRGHLTQLDFHQEFKKWEYPPPDRLFDAPVQTSYPPDMKNIAQNIENQARQADILYIWTDCDREGEHIGSEIREAARKGKRNIQVFRARFSNIERAHILSAAQRPVALDERQAEAVAARIELDLRIGSAFTRFLTLSLRTLGGALADLVLSYGSCQFPTLGFVVDRYFRVQNFVPEPFWSIKVMHEKEGVKVNFNWSRNRLFDRLSVLLFYERCLVAQTAKVTNIKEKQTKKWKPLPLTTVELQKMATRFLRMTGQEAMTVAEKLYQKGFISYPRTETDRFDKGMNLRALVQKQTQDQRWGPFAQNLVDGAFQQPRQGRHDDKAHPPIHPITYAAPTVLGEQERRLYELVVRRFLACCSEDARGATTDVEITYGEENFVAHGLIVHQRNYLDVYPYENWSGTAELPRFTVGEMFEPTEAMMTEGKTTAPSYLTEADLIALMDANGIGTDATMAQHIEKIKERQYVQVVERGSGNGGGGGNDDDDGAAGGGGRGGCGGRGGGRRRGGARGGRGGGAGGGGGGRGSVKEFIPTSLGVALIQGFERMNFETSLGKPFLRKEMELKMKAICEGRLTRDAVLRESIASYLQVYDQSREEVNLLKAACRQYVFGQNGGA